ncbi:MAG: ABC transporter ATP-binding protein [Lachnospiraceae bacterium]|nr:ABC transporter ATP-binding protein [Lachnospiraceae bacterium]
MKLIKRVIAILTERQRKLLVFMLLMMLVGAGLETAGTSLLIPFITIAMEPDSVFQNEYLKYFYDLMHLTSVNGFLVMLSIVLSAVFVLKNIYLYFMYYVQYRFIYNGQFNTSRSLFKDYVRRPYEFYLDASTPVVMRHIMSDVNGSYNLLLTFLQLFTELFIFAALLVLALVYSPAMTLVMCAVLGIILLANKMILGPILRRFGHEVQTNSALTTKWIMQAVNGMKETKVLNKERYFVEQYEKSADKLNTIQKRQNSMQNIPRLMIETVCMCGILLVMAVFLSIGNNLNEMITQLGVLAVVAIKLMPSANKLSTYINNIAYYEPSLTAVEDIIIRSHQKDVDTDILFLKKEIEPMDFSKEVKLENITYRYPNTEVNILENASVSIPIGKSIGFIGPSGAGKSTTVDILLGLLEPQKGKVTVDGIDIRTNLPGWYARIGYVPQMIFMLDDTIRNNVAYGVDEKDIDEEQVWYALREAQMDEFVRGLPDGLDTSIGERGVRISGGQRQRLGIARALYTEPEIMIFDEATSALDNDTESAIMEAIERLHGKKTLVIIAHRLTTIEKCDAVYRVEEQGFHKER